MDFTQRQAAAFTLVTRHITRPLDAPRSTATQLRKVISDPAEFHYDQSKKRLTSRPSVTDRKMGHWQPGKDERDDVQIC